MNQVKGAGAKWSKKANSRLSILFLHKQNSCLPKRHIWQFTLSRSRSFHTHLVSTYNGQRNSSLFQIWIFNPKWKSGSHVDKYYSKVHSTGSRVAPRFPACESSEQGGADKPTRQQFPKCGSSLWELVRNANSRAAQTEESGAPGAGLGHLILRTRSAVWGRLLQINNWGGKFSF